MRILDSRICRLQAAYDTQMSTSPSHTVIADNLKRLLAAEGIARKRLAIRMGTSPSSLTSMLNASSDRIPSVRSVERAASALKVAPWCLLVPDLPSSAVAVREFERAAVAVIHGAESYSPDPAAGLPADEADLIMAYRSMSESARAGLRALLVEVKQVPVPAFLPPGGLTAAHEDDDEPRSESVTSRS